MSTRLKNARSDGEWSSPAAPFTGARSTAQELLGLLISQGPLSRSALAETLHVSRARVTDLSRELLEAGLILETQAASQRRQGKGRPFVHLAIDASYGFCLGISVTDSRIHLLLTDLSGTVQAEQTVPTSVKPQQLVEIVQRSLTQLLDKAGIARKRMLSIGLAISGFVDRERGVCLHSANLGWHDVPIASLITQATGLPTVLENDANAAATSEKLFGLARETQNFTLITLGASIGCAHYIGGQLYRGSHGGAGEIAHSTVELGGQVCLCGKRGCLDTVASRAALLEAADRRGLQAASVGELERAASNGDAQARNILQRGSQVLGLVIANIVQSNEPELVLIADPSGFGQGLFLTNLRHTIENNILPRFLRTTRIEVHAVPDEFWARGAASIATHQFLSHYTSESTRHAEEGK